MKILSMKRILKEMKDLHPPSTIISKLDFNKTHKRFDWASSFPTRILVNIEFVNAQVKWTEYSDDPSAGSPTERYYDIQ